jgi:hypothetical protein
MAGFSYKSYSFIDKDPIIDQIRTIYQDSGANYMWIKEHSGVSPNTLVNWFGGKTRRPQAATVNAVLRCLGYQLSITPMRQPVHISPPLPQPKTKPRSERHIIQMTKYNRKKEA